MKVKDKAYENKVLAVDPKDETKALIDHLIKKYEMSRDERSLLLYFESCAVEHGGKVQSIRMNNIDFMIVKNWVDSKFIQFGRIAFHDIKEGSSFTNWVVLSEEAWKIAHEERRTRCERIMKKLDIERIGLK